MIFCSGLQAGNLIKRRKVDSSEFGSIYSTMADVSAASQQPCCKSPRPSPTISCCSTPEEYLHARSELNDSSSEASFDIEQDLLSPSRDGSDVGNDWASPEKPAAACCEQQPDMRYIKGTRLPIDGWLQACRGCNEITGRTVTIQDREVHLCPR